MKEVLELKLPDFLNLSMEHPNDIDFGRMCRPIFPTVEANKVLPNDHDLGKFVRKFLQEIQK
jgi:hypothetical protein